MNIYLLNYCQPMLKLFLIESDFEFPTRPDFKDNAAIDDPPVNDP